MASESDVIRRHIRSAVTIRSPLSPLLLVFGRRFCTFQLCGCAGLFLGFAQSLALVHYFGLSKTVLLGITAVVILTFFALVMFTKLLTGDERIIYYHHEIAVIATTALFLRAIRQPVLPYLDIVVMGLGLFLACGRIGCLMVGCCHGRPSRWGISYSDEHAQAGFPAYLVGVRLFPIQAVESMFALAVVAYGVLTILRHSAAGTAFVFYVLVYAAGRYFFEFARGDAARPYLWGFSEAQWTSLAIAWIEVLGEHAGWVPRYPWHLIIPAGLVCCTLTVMLKRCFSLSRRFELLHPKHVREIAQWILLTESNLPGKAAQRAFVSAPTSILHVADTSVGLRISTGATRTTDAAVRHYSLSSTHGKLDVHSARLLARMLGRLRHNSQSFEFIRGTNGIFHIIFRHP